ncbi:MAG: Bro-N domain-containing protein [Bacteroidales bacterium]|nr:Bro-N domain-containing protein [Bacteroidales bacterium]
MSNIKLFQSKQIRTQWDKEQEKWYFSIVDVVEALTDSKNPRRYWSDLKRKLSNEGSQLYEEIVQLKMQSSDGKYYKTDVADTQQLLRIIQSIPSPKAEPFKQWLAKVGYERIQEVSDPEQSLNRARENWQKLGRSNKWIQQRMAGQETRNKLTDYWKESGVEKSSDFAMLTNIIHQEWTDMSIKQHKDLKGLDRQNLRDHMSEAELIFTALAELSTRQIAETDQAKGVKQNADAGKKGGKIAKDARKALELKTGKSVITSDNFLPPSTTTQEIEE